VGNLKINNMPTTIRKKISLEIEVDVIGQYIKGHPGTYYRSNGDPGDPPEPDQFEITNVIWGGLDITDHLSDDNFDFYELEEECLENIRDEEPDYHYDNEDQE
jgi:hypothetical protein